MDHAGTDLDWSLRISVAAVFAAFTSLKSSESRGLPCRKTIVLPQNFPPSAFLHAPAALKSKFQQCYLIMPYMLISSLHTDIDGNSQNCGAEIVGSARQTVRESGYRSKQ